MKRVPTFNNTSIFYRGKDLDAGPLPAFFYFSLSAKDSLDEYPYNQVVANLSHEDVRIFSMTLPYHGGLCPKNEAVQKWARDILEGKDLIEDFCQRALEAIEHLKEQNLLTKHLAVCGLSRGAFIATHLAARYKDISTILGFAPMISLDLSPEESFPALRAYDLIHLKEALLKKKIRFYIGNHDTRVFTKSCFDFIYHLSQEAFLKKIRPAPFELILYPSIGYRGHGTPDSIFNQGSRWIWEQLNV